MVIHTVELKSRFVKPIYISRYFRNSKPLVCKIVAKSNYRIAWYKYCTKLQFAACAPRPAGRTRGFLFLLLSRRHVTEIPFVNYFSRNSPPKPCLSAYNQKNPFNRIAKTLVENKFASDRSIVDHCSENIMTMVRGGDST